MPVRSVRRPAVAGIFYPADREALGSLVSRLMETAIASPGTSTRVPKALIVPHAGYTYSGPVAASGYARLASSREHVRHVVLLGPAHRVWFEGLALPGAAALETPFGTTRVRDLAPAGVTTNARAHADEHSLEVQLPFIDQVLGAVEVTPLLVGDASAEEVASVLESLWGDAATVVIVSSDLSHYHDWRTATALDSETAVQIEALGPPLSHDQACGATPINGLLLAAARHHLVVERLDLRNSGDTTGPRDRVVGYGAFAFYEPDGDRP
jgi:AmmeMemoRadiSam system protein B